MMIQYGHYIPSQLVMIHLKLFILVIRVVISSKLTYQEFQFSILERLTMMNLGLIIMKTTILMRNWVYRL